ncbi:hypothetical protein CVS40_10898 [Lucilia cuprina]|nr:hypothetical protein CVS40_10898 [Lucilia cuprina]
MQPTEQNASDCCLMVTTTDVSDDRDEIQHAVDINSTSNNTIATTTTKTTTTIQPAYEQILQHTTTALPTTATSIINPLGTLPIIPETSTSSMCDKTNVPNPSCTTAQSTAAIEPTSSLIEISTSNSTSNTNNISSPHDNKLVDEVL